MDTQGFIPDTINLIADNLRDRYDSGFPIIKELIQNADDARARAFSFARHPGFPGADHPLLRGPALWFFNDGQFKASDKRALRSFGINSKAGDTTTIGKFGLGMKSVFHLCEALFYVAWDGALLHREILNPGKNADGTLHPEWDGRKDSDWADLELLGHEVAGTAQPHWFLLWIPLRRQAHLRRDDGHETGAIIKRFPGDDPGGELGFLTESSLALDLAEVLPVLKHLEVIEHRDSDNPFTLKLSSNARLIGGAEDVSKAHGQILSADGTSLQCFAGIRRTESVAWAEDLKQHPKWPEVRYRDEYNHEQIAADKTRAEAAVLFYSGKASNPAGHLQWAVFLPLEEGKYPLKFVDRPGHSLIFHGQFFVDAGRRKVHDQNALHEPPDVSPTDEPTLRQTWNRLLAQRILAPTVIVALEHYVEQTRLDHANCEALTRALQTSDWFQRFQPYACRSDAWVRALDSKGARWQRVTGTERDRLRPMPRPPQEAPERPWRVFPHLAAMGVTLYDGKAPLLTAHRPQWKESELTELLITVNGLFRDEPSMAYLESMLKEYAAPFISTAAVQEALLRLLRSAMSSTDSAGRRAFAEKGKDLGKRLLTLVAPERRLDLAATLPETVLRSLWRQDASILLIPRELVSDRGTASPDEALLTRWLEVLDQAIGVANTNDLEALLNVVRGLLPTDRQQRGRFLLIHNTLRVIAVRDPASGRNRVASTAEIQEAHTAGTLFGFSGLKGQGELGLTPLLSGVIPGAHVWVVQADLHRDLFGETDLPRADDVQAILAAVGRYTGTLGGLDTRCALLEKANDPGNGRLARRGLRYLLHGSSAHREEDAETLWLPGHRQHRAWTELWRQLHGAHTWTLILDEIAKRDPIRRSVADNAGVKDLEPGNLLTELQRPDCHLTAPHHFGIADREEILSQIEDEQVWRRLPLHTRLDNENQPIGADQSSVYLAPDTAIPQDPLLENAILLARARDPRVRQQQDSWLKPLDDRARLELALQSETPANHWQVILNTLTRIGPGIDPGLRQRLRTVAWLKTREGEPVKPEDVIELPPGLADEVQRLVSEHRAATESATYAVPTDLAVEVREHPVWGAQRLALWSASDAGLEKLALLLEDLEPYWIGPWQSEPDAETIKLLARCPSLPGWRLLRQAQDGAVPLDSGMAWLRLREGLIKPLETATLKATLKWLTTATSDWKTRKRAFDQHLDWLKDSPGFTLQILPTLKLASRDGQWRPVTELCTGAHGLDPTWELDPDQARRLTGLIHRAGATPTDPSKSETPTTAAGFDLVLQAAPKVMSDYFGRFDQIGLSEGMIGAVLALLGKPMRALAKRYLHPQTFEGLIEQLPWADPGRSANGRLEWMGGQTIASAFDLIQVGAQVLQEDWVAAPNVLGKTVRAPLDQDMRSLLAGPLSWQGGYKVSITFRRLSDRHLDPDRCSDLLRATTQDLYASLYNQKRLDLEALWSSLDNAHQLEIGIARRLILDHLAFYLRLLSIEHRELRQALDRCDEARRRVAEIEAKGGNANRERQAQAAALESISQLISKDEAIRGEVLKGVKAKLSQYHYEVSSIPFELFQNADDAAVELGQIQAFPASGGKIPPGARRIVIELDRDAIRFLHWGRPINARGPTGFDGEGRGFGRDLEKMLVLSYSDKHCAEGVTGKFGLGFKSVLLACDRPRILSGNLALEIRAGILPEPLDEDVVSTLRQSLSQHTTPGQRLLGTLIDLPDLAPMAQDRMLERFRPLAGLVCVFAYAVHEISLGGDTIAWEPKIIAPGIEFGRLQVKVDSGGAGTDAICIRNRTGAVLLAQGPEGFRALPKWTPSIWVTAPLRETEGLAIACTASFELDAGRARLAGDSPRNLDLARKLGVEAGDSLTVLFERSQTDWPALTRKLCLDRGIAPHDFWHSLWLCVTNRCLSREREGAANLVRELALTMLFRLSTNPKAVPNGLPGAMQAMVDRGDVLYQLPKALAIEKAIEILCVWKRFTDRYPRQHLVSAEVGKILKAAKIADPQPLALPALIALIEPPKAMVEDSRALGALYLLTEDDDWKTDEVKGRLRPLRFRTLAETWKESSKLVAGGGKGIDKDEVLRYAIAPLNCRLHPEYWEQKDDQEAALTFFLLARDRLQVGRSELENWVLDAEATDVRLAALIYLSDGEHGPALAERLKTQGWLHHALHDPEICERLTEQQISRLRRFLASDEQMQQVWETPDSPQPPRPTVNLETALNHITKWWQDRGQAEAKRYRERLYPENLRLQIDDNTGRHDRSSWLMLFALGAFQSMGLTREEQHRNFVRNCQLWTSDGNSWWQIFSDLDPKRHPERWMDVIENYAEAQFQDEEWSQWIAQFPKLYKFRRWMDDYVELFLSIQRFEEPFTLDLLLTPQANPHFGGGGIDPPALNRTLRIGGPLVIRELLHHCVITNPLAIPHAYAPIQRIRDWFADFGQLVETSQDIYNLLEEHLGADQATFGNDYDLPLRILTLAEHEPLRHRIMYE